MSSKHPVTAETTADTVTIVSGRTSPEQTSDYSGSGDPTLVHWHRRPYDLHAYPQCTSATGSGSGVVGGVTNPRSFAAIDLPKKQIEDLDFDAKPSATYQSLTNLPSGLPYGEHYTSMGTTHKANGERRPASSCNKCTVCLWFFVILALLLACGGVALGILHILEDSGSSESSVSSLESQLTDSNAKIAKLESMINELQANLSKTIETKNVELQELSLQLDRVNQSVDRIITASTDDSSTTAEPVTTVNLTTNCEYDLIQKCRISDVDLTPVEGGTSDSYPNYSSCFTPSIYIDNGTGTFVQDVYCAVTNFRDERNPVIATLRHDQDSGTLSCYCFVTALETRRSVVDCSMFLKRCPSVATIN